MKQKFFTLLCVLLTSTGTMLADYLYIPVGDLYYHLNTTEQQAQVMRPSGNDYESLTSVVIPSSITFNDVIYTVTGIDNDAFQNCTNLESVTFPNTIVSISRQAFQGCSMLASIELPNSLITIGNHAFSSCDKLTSVTIPDEVTTIGENAFALCSNMNSIILSKKLTRISPATFFQCYSLSSITIPENVISIGYSAFFQCYALTSIIIPSGVTTIENGAFSDCNNLKYVEIPSSVTTIENGAFSYCYGLSIIRNNAHMPQTIDDYMFSGVNISTCFLYVPADAVELYKTADVWKNFSNIVGLTEREITINCHGIDNSNIYSITEIVTFPVAPTIEGFTFIKWKVVESDLSDGVHIQAIYTANTPTSAPEVYTNPSNPAQKLIRNGNIYILTDDKTYTITGQEVK